MGLFPGMTFVDVGCGIGRDAFQLLDVTASRAGTTQWKATFAIPLSDGVYANDPQYPRGAVAYTDAAMRRLMREAGLATDKPYVKGAWSGLHGDAAEEGQDAVILRRA